MKLITLFSLLALSTTALSAQTDVYCWGQNEDGSQVRYVVDQQQKAVQLERQIVTKDMPPYPFVLENSWSLNTLEFNDTDLTISGTTTGVTTGKHGRLFISAGRTGISTAHGLKRVFFAGTAHITPPTKVVKPVPAKIIEVSCQTQTQLEAPVQTVGERCTSAVTAYMKKKAEAIFKGDGDGCGFENANVSNTMYTGEVYSVLQVRVDACGGSGVEETVVENRTCKVLDSSMVYSD